MEMEMETDKYIIENGTAFNKETKPNVRLILSQYIGKNVRIRLFFGDAQSGKDHCEEYDIMGYLGRTTGTYKIPILCHNKRSLGGDAVSDSSIVKITVDKKVVYQHPSYHMPLIFSDTFAHGNDKEYKYHLVYQDEPNRIWGSFKTKEKCDKCLSFLKGETNRK